MQDRDFQTKRRPGQVKYYLFFVILLMFVASFIFWADRFNLGIVSVAEGEVKPRGEAKTIQHLEGGIIKKILVKEGERVAKWQRLVILESTLSDADVKELGARYDFLRIKIIRLKAEAQESGKIYFPDKLANKNSELIRQEKGFYKANKNKLTNELKIADEKINQKKQEISEVKAQTKETKARLKNNRNSLKLIEEQVAISEDLMKDDLTNRYNHLTLLKEASALNSLIEEDEAVLERLNAMLLRQESSLRDTMGLKKNIRLIFFQNARAGLEESQKELREINERIRKAKDNLKRTILKSPVAGIIKKLYIVTEGGVVSPGSPIVDLIPAEESLVIEARLLPYDIGYVSVGHKGNIRLKSSDAIRFGNIAVKVVHISPDTFPAPNGSAYYKVVLEPETDHFQSKSGRYNLVPGVEVVSSIHTGDRSVLEYIFEPFLTSANNALQER